jgi:adenine phosphoribosyltransferase
VLVANLDATIRTIPDFPKQGIQFKDITTLLREPVSLRQAVDDMLRPFADQRIDKIVGIESRGFIFATAMAYKIGAGFVPIRKPGKLPATTIRQEYELEYGSDAVEIHVDAITPGEQVLLVDDLLATGGTAEASVAMLQRLEAKIIGLSFLIELDFLAGREKLSGQNVHAVLHY